MRNAIRTQLLTKMTELTGVWQPNMADKNTALPYAVVKFGSEYEANVKHSFSKTVDVWIYTERTNYNTLDALVTKCIKALNDVQLTTAGGILFGLEYTGVSPDGFFDTDLEALTKTVSFTHGFIRK